MTVREEKINTETHKVEGGLSRFDLESITSNEERRFFTACCVLGGTERMGYNVLSRQYRGLGQGFGNAELFTARLMFCRERRG